MTKKIYKVFFLDRDGVINTNNFPSTPEQFEFMPKALNAFFLLRKKRKMVFIATNQGGIEAGFLTEEALAKIHDYMQGEIIKHGGRIHHIYHCPSIDAGHPDRKPNPGMILNGFKDHNLGIHYEQEDFCFIGDHITDWQAAIAAGIDPIAIKSERYWEYDAYKLIDRYKIPIYKSLYEAVITHTETDS